MDAGLHEGHYVVCRDAADGTDGHGQSLGLHGLHYPAVAVQTDDGRQVGFGRGIAEGPEADVVGVGLAERADVVDGIGRGADDEALAQDGPRFVDGHVVPAKVDAVGFDALAELDAVVDDEGGVMVAASLEQTAGDGFHLAVVAVFHAQLNPLAAAFKGLKGGLLVVPWAIGLGNELYRYHADVCLKSKSKQLYGNGKKAVPKRWGAAQPQKPQKPHFVV